MRFGLHAVAGNGAPSIAAPDQAPIRVVVADRHAGTRRVVRLLLEPEVDVDVVAESSSLTTPLHALRCHRPQVLALDPHSHDGSGVDAVRRVREQVPRTEIVVITMDDCAALAIHMLNAGAAGFVLKDRADGELAPAIRHAARGDQHISPRMAGLVAHETGTAGDLPSRTVGLFAVGSLASFPADRPLASLHRRRQRSNTEEARRDGERRS